MRIRVVLTGRGYDAANLPAEIELPGGATVAAALAAIEPHTGGKLAASTLIIVSGQHLGTLAAYDDVPLADGGEVMLLQPVAGG